MVFATSARGLADRRIRAPCQRPIPDQIADIRHDPVGAGLDELIVVELIEIFDRTSASCSAITASSASSGLPCSTSRIR